MIYCNGYYTYFFSTEDGLRIGGREKVLTIIKELNQLILQTIQTYALPKKLFSKDFRSFLSVTYCAFLPTKQKRHRHFQFMRMNMTSPRLKIFFSPNPILCIGNPRIFSL